MTWGDTRTVLERLAAGEITPEEAEEFLAGEDERPPALGSTGAGSARRVSAMLSGGGRIEVQGGSVDAPRVDGPARCNITGDEAHTRIEGQIGDDGVLLVPDDCDLRLHLNGASAAIVGIRGTLDATINAGDVDIECELDEGDSRLRLNAGELHLRFGARSDVRVKVLAPTSVHGDGSISKVGRGEWLLGEGRATLEIDGNLGAITLTVE